MRRRARATPPAHGAVWYRDGTIVGPSSTQIDLTDGRGNWLSVKGRSDKEAERIAALLLQRLNLPARLR